MQFGHLDVRETTESRLQVPLENLMTLQTPLQAAVSDRIGGLIFGYCVERLPLVDGPVEFPDELFPPRCAVRTHGFRGDGYIRAPRANPVVRAC